MLVSQYSTYIQIVQIAPRVRAEVSALQLVCSLSQTCYYFLRNRTLYK